MIADHPGTPWAYLAERELEQSLGWQWIESFTEIEPAAAAAAGNNNPRPRRDEQKQMLPPPKPQRPIPKL